MKSDKKKKPKRGHRKNYQDVVDRSLKPLKDTEQKKLFEDGSE